MRRRDRLRGHPQERQHSAAVGGTRDRMPPARSTTKLARGIVTEWPRRRIPSSGSKAARGAKRLEPDRQRRTRPRLVCYRMFSVKIAFQRHLCRNLRQFYAVANYAPYLIDALFIVVCRNRQTFLR